MNPAEDLRPGMTWEVSREVTPDMSASHLGSGTVGVLSTPSMIMMMEAAAMKCVQAALTEGETTVGYVVNVRHLAPTAIGQVVRATARLDLVDARRLTFHVEAHEGDCKIGDGEHTRVIVVARDFVPGAGA